MLIIVRHGQSEWNLNNLFTGICDPKLSKKGLKESLDAGKKIKNLNIFFHIAFTSYLKRAKSTCKNILYVIGQKRLKIIKDQVLNERDYGYIAGMNKDVLCKTFGEEQVNIWRRSYNIPPPGGESLSDISVKIWPYYLYFIQPYILDNKNVLLVSHGNTIRSLIMLIEKKSKKDIFNIEVQTGIPIVYDINLDMTVKTKTILF